MFKNLLTEPDCFFTSEARGGRGAALPQHQTSHRLSHRPCRSEKWAYIECVESFPGIRQYQHTRMKASENCCSIGRTPEESDCKRDT